MFVLLTLVTFSLNNDVKEIMSCKVDTSRSLKPTRLYRVPPADKTLLIASSLTGLSSSCATAMTTIIRCNNLIKRLTKQFFNLEFI